MRASSRGSWPPCGKGKVSREPAQASLCFLSTGVNSSLKLQPPPPRPCTPIPFHHDNHASETSPSFPNLISLVFYRSSEKSYENTFPESRLVLELAWSHSVLCIFVEAMTGPGKTVASQQTGDVCLLFKQILMVGNYAWFFFFLSLFDFPHRISLNKVGPKLSPPFPWDSGAFLLQASCSLFCPPSQYVLTLLSQHRFDLVPIPFRLSAMTDTLFYWCRFYILFLMLSEERQAVG